MDREARAREILDAARRARRPTPRWVWTWAILISVVCLGALAIGLIRHEL
jgi:hypothetical protein